MKIMIIAASHLPIPAYKGGATETLITDLLKRMKKYGNIEIVVYSHCNGNERKEKNIKYCYLKRTLFQKIYFFWFLFLRILSMKKRNIPDNFPIQISKHENLNDYDMIILEGNKDQVHNLRKKYNGIIVLHIHTVMTLTKSTYKAKSILEECNYIIVNSNFAKKKVAEIEETQSYKIVELKNCIEVSKYKYGDLITKKIMREKYGIDKDEFVCIYCGRLEKGKGVLELIKAYIRSEIEGKLLIIGANWFSSSKSTKYIRLLKSASKSISRKIIFTGYIPHEVIPDFYCMANIAIMPSIYEESAGLVALEAQASGLPVIISNIGGIPEFIHQDSKLKVNVDDEFVDNISILIKKLFDDKNFFDSEKKKSLENIKQFDMERYEKEFLKILNKILEREEKFEKMCDLNF